MDRHRLRPRAGSERHRRATAAVDGVVLARCGACSCPTSSRRNGPRAPSRRQWTELQTVFTISRATSLHAVTGFPDITSPERFRFGVQQNLAQRVQAGDRLRPSARISGDGGGSQRAGSGASARHGPPDVCGEDARSRERESEAESSIRGANRCRVRRSHLARM